MKFKLLVLILVVAAVFWYCTKPKTTTPQQITKNKTKPTPTPPQPTITPPPTNGLTEPNNWGLGISSMPNYGTNYFNYLDEVAGGISRFWFYGKSNGNNYPTGKNGNGYETVSLASHSVNPHGQPENQNDVRGLIKSKCKYTIRDSEQNIVLYVEDTKGGSGMIGRHNNHPDNCYRYLPTGTYTIEYQNLNDQPNEVHHVVFYRQDNGYHYQVNENVSAGQTITRTVNITDTGTGPNILFKFNCDLAYISL